MYADPGNRIFATMLVSHLKMDNYFEPILLARTKYHVTSALYYQLKYRSILETADTDSTQQQRQYMC